METKLIGNLNQFAIEYGATDSIGELRRADCKIWLGGRYIGDVGSPIYLASLSSSLHAPLGVQELNIPLPNLLQEPEDLLSLMESEVSYDIFRHYFVPIGGFDDFLKLIYRTGDDFVFFTSLHPQVVANTEYAKYPKDVRETRVPVETYRKVVDEFEKSIALRKC
jgi:hypothetical protein